MAAAAPYSAVPRRVVSQAIFERLRDDILDGRLAAGDPLPSERALSEAFEVNRHAVREAIKRLQQAGLVQVSQGGATRVLDWRACCGLDLLADLGGVVKGTGRRELLLAAAEMRASIGADAARLCALRAGEDVRARIAAAAESVLGDGPYLGRLERYERLWELIVEGAGNVAYRLSFNSLVSARHGHLDASIYAPEVDDPEAIAALAAAVASADAATAEAHARTLLNRTVETMS